MTGHPARRTVDVAALVVLFAGSLAVHSPAVLFGLIAVQDDVRVHYLPLMTTTAQALAQGQLPLWTPGIFGGYPLFADGEAGMLYPLHLLTLPWLPSATTLVLLRVVHTFLAASFTYGLVRVLRSSPVGAVVAGTTFALSGFAAGQAVHTNVFHAMVWLPLQLLFAERAVAAHGRGRTRYAILVGAAFGIQALALHVQITLMSALAVGAFVVVRCAAKSLSKAETPAGGRAIADDAPPGWRAAGLEALRRAFGGLASGAAILVGVGVVGVGLAAVQLFPLYELAGLSFRGGGLAMDAAATNSVWPGALVTLLIPNAFDTAAGGFWGPWVKWETALYVGILPLMLAIVGAAGRGGPHRVFFAALAATSLLAAMGPHSPLPIWSLLHSLPGFGGLQAPGRFSLLFALGIAVLAGYGADWLLRRGSSPPSRHRLGLGVASLGLVACALVVLGSEGAAQALRAGWSLLDQYPTMPGVPGTVDRVALTADRVRELAAGALSTANPTTRHQLAVLLVAVALIGAWQMVGRFGPRGRSLSRACAAIAGFALFADLGLAALTFHPLERIDHLSRPLPAFLAEGGSPLEPTRLYTPSSADDKSIVVEPNRLLPLGIQEAGGYSSLGMDRHTAFSRAVNYSDNHLLDLWNVRYLVRRRGTELFPSYGGTAFHPQRPLFAGKWGTPGAGGTLLPEDGALEASEIHVVAALWEAAEVADGSRVAQVVAEGPDGERRALSLRAGRHVSDALLDAPHAGQTFRHGRAEVAFRYQDSDPAAERYGEQLYYARLNLNPPMVVSRVTVEKMGRAGGLEVFGLGLVSASTREVTQVRTKEKFRLVYQDASIRILENTAVMPRAFLVRDTWQAPKGSDVLALMLDGPFDPRETAIVECEPIGSSCAPLKPSTVPERTASGEKPQARILAYRNHEVAVQTTSATPATLILTDTYFPGWKAFVDDRPAPLLRADYLFRGVPVPAGTHSVRLVYEPLSIALGAVTTLATWGVVSALGAVWLLRAWAARRQAPALSWPWARGSVPRLRRAPKLASPVNTASAE